MFFNGSQDNKLFSFDPRVLSEKDIKLGDIADDIIYIPLDNKYPLGVSPAFEITNNSIFINSKDGLIALNRQGKTARKIGSVGRGPGEYLFGGFFAVDNKTETAYVKDQNFVIKVYSKNGNFIRSINLPKSEDGNDFWTVNIFHSKLFLPQYINMGRAKYNWIIIDTLGNVIREKKNSIPPFPCNFGAKGGTYKFKEEIFYFNFYNDTIFSVSTDLNYKPAFLFEKGEHRFPMSKLPSFDLSPYMFLHFIFETKQYLFLDYGYRGRSTGVVIDKKSKKIFNCYTSSGTNEQRGFLNNIDGGLRIYVKTHFEENGKEYIIGFLDPFLLKTHVSSNEFEKLTPLFPEKKKKLVSLANSLEETDNPIMVMVRLK
jgi:hypothetical protein